jgi:hypothetical protein
MRISNTVSFVKARRAQNSADLANGDVTSLQGQINTLSGQFSSLYDDVNGTGDVFDTSVLTNPITIKITPSSTEIVTVYADGSGGSSYTLEQIAEAVWSSVNAAVSEIEFGENMSTEDVIINSDGAWYPVGTAGMKSVIYNAGAYSVAIRMGDMSTSDGFVLEQGYRISVGDICYVRSQKTGNFNVRLVVTR